MVVRDDAAVSGYFFRLAEAIMSFSLVLNKSGGLSLQEGVPNLFEVRMNNNQPPPPQKKKKKEKEKEKKEKKHHHHPPRPASPSFFHLPSSPLSFPPHAFSVNRARSPCLACSVARSDGVFHL